MTSAGSNVGSSAATPRQHDLDALRMPLFFMLSGYFTVMLWRRRGLKQLMWNREALGGRPRWAMPTLSTL